MLTFGGGEAEPGSPDACRRNNKLTCSAGENRQFSLHSQAAALRVFDIPEEPGPDPAHAARWPSVFGPLTVTKRRWRFPRRLPAHKTGCV